MAGMAKHGLYGMVWHAMPCAMPGQTSHGMVWYGMVWYGMVWYGMPVLVQRCLLHCCWVRVLGSHTT